MGWLVTYQSVAEPSIAMMATANRSEMGPALRGFVSLKS